LGFSGRQRADLSGHAQVSSPDQVVVREVWPMHHELRPKRRNAITKA
jgi:hypothetical protein